jgi:hypothetical protein
VVVAFLAEVRAGKFWKPLGPSSASPASLGLTPLPPWSMPRPALEKMEFERIRLPLALLMF